MSPLLFVAPIAVIAMVSLWMGWMGRIWLFVAWAAFWTAVVVITLTYVFSSTSGFGLIALMGAAVAVIMSCVFAMGWLAQRARKIGASDE